MKSSLIVHERIVQKRIDCFNGFQIEFWNIELVNLLNQIIQLLRILFSRMLDMGAEALWSKSTKNCKSAGVQELLDEEVATIFFTKNNRFSGSATASNHATTNHGLGMHVEYFILNPYTCFNWQCQIYMSHTLSHWFMFQLFWML